MMAAALVLGAAQCAEAATIELGNVNTGSVTLKVGQTYGMGATFTKASKKAFKSSNSAVVSVSGSGTLKAKKTGKATAELILSRCSEDGSREVLGEFHLVYTSPFGGRYVGITKDTKDMSAAPVRFEGSFELTRRPAECVHIGGK